MKKTDFYNIAKGDTAFNELLRIFPDKDKLEIELNFFINCINDNDTLSKCTGRSLFTCFYSGLKAGASFEPSKNHVYLIPKAGKCTIDYTYYFIISKLQEQNMLKDFKIQAVYLEDKVADIDMFNATLKHITSFDRTEVIGAYCLIDWGTGRRLELLTKGDLAEIIKDAEKKNGGRGWNRYKSEFAKKSVFKRCVKYIPIFAEMEEIQTIIHEDNKQFQFENNEAPPAFIPATQTIAPTKTIENETLCDIENAINITTEEEVLNEK